MRTSGHVLSLAAMFLRQAYYCYFGISLSGVHTPKWVSDQLYPIILDRHCVDVMKTGRLNLRLSERRVAKLKAYANYKEKTLTQLIEDWIDRLPLPERLEASDPPASRRGTPP